MKLTVIIANYNSLGTGMLGIPDFGCERASAASFDEGNPILRMRIVHHGISELGICGYSHRVTGIVVRVRSMEDHRVRNECPSQTVAQMRPEECLVGQVRVSPVDRAQQKS